MVESLANNHVDGFCVGAPWNSVAVDLGVGFILHLMSEVFARAAEKVLALSQLTLPHRLAQVLLVEPRRLRDRAAELLDEEAALAEVLAGTWGAEPDALDRLTLPFDRLLASSTALDAVQSALRSISVSRPAAS